MSLAPKNVARANDWYPIRDVDATNNVGSDLSAGDLVLLDWTAPGVDNSLISPSSLALLGSHVKAICLAAIKASAVGRVRVQGPVNAGLAAGTALAAGDPIIGKIAGNSTDNGLIDALAVVGLGTVGTYTGAIVGAALETKASSASAQTVSVIFDGSHLNSLYLKD